MMPLADFLAWEEAEGSLFHLVEHLAICADDGKLYGVTNK